MANQRLVDKYKEDFNFASRTLQREPKEDAKDAPAAPPPAAASSSSFFDNISSSTREERPETSALMKMRDQDRRKNAETFGLPYYPQRGRGYRSRYGGHFAPPDYHRPPRGRGDYEYRRGGSDYDYHHHHHRGPRGGGYRRGGRGGGGGDKPHF